MILIFGGTTEGRKAVTVCDEAGKPYYYSTKEAFQEIDSANGIRLAGVLDEPTMFSLCKEKNIKLIINAAHPFAEILHQNIAIVSAKLNIPVIRLERNYPERDNGALWFDSYNDAIDYLKRNNIRSLLALTGVNTISKLKPYWSEYDCWFRILDREESRRIVEKEGFPLDKIIYFYAIREQSPQSRHDSHSPSVIDASHNAAPCSKPHNTAFDETFLFKKLKPQAIIVKESGDSGGFGEKISAALRMNIPALVIKRPALSDSFVFVYGENGLRKQIETLLPYFFDLKTGYTTGACATAATKAALTALLTTEHQTEISILLPNGEWIKIPVVSTQIDGDKASCTVIKDAGDDPDITNGMAIVSTVRISDTHNGVHFLQGKGVGTVTLPGLGLDIGSPAINKVPRMMMKREIFNVMRLYRNKHGVDVTISVPNGEEVAKKTFNPKLGVTGGISVIGTSGIVKPFSSEAFVASIEKEMEVAKALGCSHIVINSGAKSERFVKRQYPGLSTHAFVHYGNFIGESVRIASELGFVRLTMGVMLGKAVKLAEGFLDTHSKKVVMNKDFIISVARQSGCSEKTVEAIQNITMARQLWDIIQPDEYSFFNLIQQKCYATCKPLFQKGDLNIFLINENGGIIF